MSLYKYSTKRGDYYGIRFRCIEEGRECHKNLRGFKTQRDAKQAKYDYLHEIELQLPVSEELVDDITMTDLFERYMIYGRTAIAPQSLYDYDKIARKFILPVFGERKLKSITRKELSNWQDSFPSRFSYKYKTKLRCTMSVLYSYAVEKEFVAENLMSKVHNIPNPDAPREFEYWTYSEFQQFISAIDEPRWATLFTFLYLSGCRKGEAFALTWDDVDFEKQLINISKTHSLRAEIAVKKLKATPKKGTKNKKAGKIYMPKSMMDMLAALPKHKYVFGLDDNKPLSANTLDNVFKRYVKRANVKKIRLHDFRHSCAALIISQSDSELTALYAVAERLRDTPTQILKTYGHLFPSRQRELNKRLDELFG